MSGSTSRVLRLRALTPTSSAPSVDGTGGLGLVVHLDEHGHPELAGLVVQPAQQVVVERGDDQQDQVGAGGAGLEHLVGLDHEVLAQQRDVDRGADRAEVVEAAAEPALLGEHADRGGTAGGVADGRGRRDRRSPRGRPCSGCAASPRRSRWSPARAGAASGRGAGRRRRAPPAGRPRWSAARRRARSMRTPATMSLSTSLGTDMRHSSLACVPDGGAGRLLGSSLSLVFAAGSSAVGSRPLRPDTGPGPTIKGATRVSYDNPPPPPPPQYGAPMPGAAPAPTRRRSGHWSPASSACSCCGLSSASPAIILGQQRQEGDRRLRRGGRVWRPRDRRRSASSALIWMVISIILAATGNFYYDFDTD